MGSFFRGQVKPGTGDNAGYWVATLNGDMLGAHREKEWAKGRVENELITKLYNARHAIRIVKNRAPTSTDLYTYGAPEKFNAARNTGFE